GSIDKLLVVLEGLIRGVKATSRRFVGLVLPFWAKASDYQAWGPGLRWFLRIVFLAAVFVLVWWLQNYLEKANYVHRPEYLRGPESLQDIWLPTLVVLVIVFFWIGCWIWKLWTQEAEGSPIPDVDA